MPGPPQLPPFDADMYNNKSSSKRTTWHHRNASIRALEIKTATVTKKIFPQLLKKCRSNGSVTDANTKKPLSVYRSVLQEKSSALIMPCFFLCRVTETVEKSFLSLEAWRKPRTSQASSSQRVKPEKCQSLREQWVKDSHSPAKHSILGGSQLQILLLIHIFDWSC